MGFDLGGALGGGAAGAWAGWRLGRWGGPWLGGAGAIIGGVGGFIGGGFARSTETGEGIKDRVARAVTGRSLLPTLEQKAEVSVWGNPQASRRLLYWQAAAIAFGLCKPRARGTVFSREFTNFDIPASMIALNWNTEENAVHLTLYQRISWGILQIGGTPDADRRCQIFDGPPENIVGGQWEWFAGATARSFPGVGASKAIDLDADGKNFVNSLQLTSWPAYIDKNHTSGRISQSPAPPGDLNSRSFPTNASDPAVRSLDPTAWYTSPEYLLFSALSSPCGTGDNTFAPLPPPATITTLTTTGITPVAPTDPPWWSTITLPFFPGTGSSPLPPSPPASVTGPDGNPVVLPPPQDLPY